VCALLARDIVIKIRRVNEVARKEFLLESSNVWGNPLEINRFVRGD
jgi:hypothetical protein